MSRNFSNSQVKVGWILATALTNSRFPAAAELNSSCLDLTDAISWNDYQIGASESGDLDDRSLLDLGNAVSRGAGNYSATLSMFRDQFNSETDSIYVDAFEAFRVERTLGYLITRVNKDATLAWAAGDEISIYKLLATTVSDQTEGETSTKFTVSFLKQGLLYVHTMVAAAGVISGVPLTKTASIAAGPYQLAPVVAGASIMSRATYTTSDSSVATVSVSGTVTPVGSAAETADITVSYGAATAPIVQAVTLAA